MASETAYEFAVILPLMIAALIWLTLAVFAPGWLARIRRAWADWSGILIILAGLSVIGLGMATFLHGNKQLSWRVVAIAAYDTACLFTLNIDEGDLEKHGALGALAAASAAVFAVLFAFGVIAALFRDSLATFRLLIARRHVVVCGLGRTGRRIIEDLHRRNTSQLIVAIDINPQVADDLFLHSRGVIALIGNATKEETLRKAGVSRASEIFVATGGDEQNIECAMAIADLSQPNQDGWWRGLGRQLRRYKTRCFVHVVNRDLAEIFRAKSDDLEKDLPGLDIEVFSAAERTALKLMESMTRAMPLPGPDDVVHLVLLGFGKFGQSLALHLAELAHFPNHRRLRITIADRGIRESARPFLARHHHFCRSRDLSRAEGDEPWAFSTDQDEWGSQPPDSITADGRSTRVIDWICNASFAEVDDACDEAFVRRLSAAFAESRVWPAVIVAFDDDRINFTTAERLKEMRDRIGGGGGRRWPIFAWIPGRQELARLLNHESSMTGVRAFGSCDDDAFYSDIADAWTERLANLINYAYGGRPRLDAFVDAVGNAAAPTPRLITAWHHFAHDAHAAWQQTRAVMKPSNRSAAAHGVIKLAALGWHIAGVGKCNTSEIRLASDQCETLARMEHYRWVAERLLAGWSFGEPNVERRTRPHFVPYEDLTQDSQDNDRLVVRTLAALCRFGQLRLERLVFAGQPGYGQERETPANKL